MIGPARSLGDPFPQRGDLRRSQRRLLGRHPLRLIGRYSAQQLAVVGLSRNDRDVPRLELAGRDLVVIEAQSRFVRFGPVTAYTLAGQDWLDIAREIDGRRRMVGRVSRIRDNWRAAQHTEY
jgi:hypothetical protein